MKTENGLYKTKGSSVYPTVARAIQKLGQDVSLARRSRRISTESFAQSMGSSRATLYRLEKGVSAGGPIASKEGFEGW